MSTDLTVMIQIQADDPALSQDAIAAALSTTAGTLALRRRVVEMLAAGEGGLAAVLPSEMAQLLLQALDAAARDMGDQPGVIRPPADYVPPMPAPRRRH